MTNGNINVSYNKNVRFLRRGFQWEDTTPMRLEPN